ncbi:MAG: thioredoxin-like domain-containing protein, partial [Thermoguttaceae bacterium]
MGLPSAKSLAGTLLVSVLTLSADLSVQAKDPEHPFARRQKVPQLPQNLTWLNTAGPLELHDLRGKFVLLDFWTYCCINCMHILPELHKLEQAWPRNLVVIGVHS